MTPIYKTLQASDEGYGVSPCVALPWVYSHEPGQQFVIQYKRAGEVVLTKTWVCIEYEDDGETFRDWAYVPSSL